jgi:hypothetical protein
MPLPRTNIHSKGIRTLADIEARCLLEGDCLRWQGAVTKDGMPTLWIPNVGPRGLQVGFHLGLTGSAVLPDRLAYIPTCGNLWCCDVKHRRKGTRSDLAVLINSRITDAKRAAFEKRREHYAAIRAEKELLKPPKPVKPPKAEKAPKPVKVAKVAAPAAGPKLHDVLDRMHSRRGPAMPTLRQPGSSVRKIDALVLNRIEPTEATITSATKLTVCPSGADQRYTVRELPKGYVSGLDPTEARPWARAAAGGVAG